jgi:hypothetical protein
MIIGMRALVLLLLVGCADDQLRPVALADYGQRALDGLCDWAVRCKHVPDDATCRRMIDPGQFDVRRAVDAVAAGRLVYDADEAARCVARPEAIGCYDAPFGGDACAHVLVGLVAQGGSCTTNLECADHATCDQATCDAQCCLGTCGAPQPPPIPPSYRALGDPCATTDECDPDAYCDPTNHCAALPAHAGDPCTFGCATGDLYCDVNDLSCHPYARIGEPCSDAAPCSATYATCGANGTCAPRPGAGDPCNSTTARCIPTTYCGAAGVCIPRGTAGDACDGGGECDIACDVPSGSCVAYETCAAP